VLFGSDQEGGVNHVYTIDADGKNLTSFAGATGFYVRWSPVGARVAVISGNYPATTIKILRLDGAQETVFPN
jgi:hypothetical protein